MVSPILLRRLVKDCHSCMNPSYHNSTLSADEICETLLQRFPAYRRIKRKPLLEALRPLIEKWQEKLEPNTSTSEFFTGNGVDKQHVTLASKMVESTTIPASTDSAVVLEASIVTDFSKNVKFSEKKDAFKNSEHLGNTDINKATEPAENSSKNSMNRQLNHLYSQNNAPQSSSKRIKKAQTGSEITNENATPFSLSARPDLRLKDFGGIETTISLLKELVIQPLQHPELFKHIGVAPPCGILLHGPPGSGKTTLAQALAGEIGCNFFEVAAPELIAGMSGDSENLIRKLFNQAMSSSPSLVFIDEIDSLAPKRDSASREMERRIVAQLGACMDQLSLKGVIVLAATNRIDALDPMIRRNGRFDRELAMGIPDEPSRAKILEVMSSSIKLEESLDFNAIAKLTPGFVGADLKALVREAGYIAIGRILAEIEPEASGYTLKQLELLSIKQSDFIGALSKVQPSSRREGFSTIPDVTWDDIGALHSLRKELEERVVFPIRYNNVYKSLGLETPAGVLLYGPPGCGKTLLAKAIANESGASFISIKGPELLNKYVGESEKAVRQVFQRARVSAPCVIFFDELDSLCSRRGTDGNPATERVVNQLLTEMDGVQDRQNVYVVAATNRPDIIDPAMLRPGRLDRLLYVPLPDTAGRVDILKALSRKRPIDPLVNFEQLAAQTDGYSGADLASLVKEALLSVIEEHRLHGSLLFAESAPQNACDSNSPSPAPALFASQSHFDVALQRIRCSVSLEQKKQYDTF